MRTRLLSLIFILAVQTGIASADLRGKAMFHGKPIENAVIWLDAPNAPRKPQTEKIVLDQRDMHFMPHVLAVQVGSVVDFPNHDRVFHNVFSLRDGKKFDLGLYPVGASKKIKFDRAGLSRIFCNIHPNMAAYVMTVDSPYFAVSDKKGEFTIKGAPAGSYAYHAWRPGGPEIKEKANLSEGETFEVTLK
jgi:plastocyanin